MHLETFRSRDFANRVLRSKKSITHFMRAYSNTSLQMHAPHLLRFKIFTLIFNNDKSLLKAPQLKTLFVFAFST